MPVAGGVLLAVIDALGHGAEAADTAHLAAGVAAVNPQEPLTAIFERCHAALQGTRGVVMSLALLSEAGTLQWTGVGNVEGILVRADPQARPSQEHIPLRGGVLGFRLPALHTASVPLRAGDSVVLATDGIAPDFSVPPFGHPQQIAEQILSKYRRGDDDALVVVARLNGAAP